MARLSYQRSALRELVAMWRPTISPLRGQSGVPLIIPLPDNNFTHGVGGCHLSNYSHANTEEEARFLIIEFSV